MYLCVDLINGFCKSWREFDANTGQLVGDVITASNTSLETADLAEATLYSASAVITLCLTAFAIRKIVSMIAEAGNI